MMKFRLAPVPPRKATELSTGEMAALRAFSQKKSVQDKMFHRLQKLGVIEQKLGKWDLTQDGHIRLALASAH